MFLHIAITTRAAAKCILCSSRSRALYNSDANRYCFADCYSKWHSSRHKSTRIIAVVSAATNRARSIADRPTEDATHDKQLSAVRSP